MCGSNAVVDAICVQWQFWVTSDWAMNVWGKKKTQNISSDGQKLVRLQRSRKQALAYYSVDSASHIPVGWLCSWVTAAVMWQFASKFLSLVAFSLNYLLDLGLMTKEYTVLPSPACEGSITWLDSKLRWVLCVWLWRGCFHWSQREVFFLLGQKKAAAQIDSFASVCHTGCWFTPPSGLTRCKSSF